MQTNKLIKFKAYGEGLGLSRTQYHRILNKNSHLRSYMTGGEKKWDPFLIKPEHFQDFDRDFRNIEDYKKLTMKAVRLKDYCEGNGFSTTNRNYKRQLNRILEENPEIGKYLILTGKEFVIPEKDFPEFKEKVESTGEYKKIIGRGIKFKDFRDDLNLSQKQGYWILKKNPGLKVYLNDRGDGYPLLIKPEHFQDFDREFRNTEDYKRIEGTRMVNFLEFGADLDLSAHHCYGILKENKKKLSRYVFREGARGKAFKLRRKHMEKVEDIIKKTNYYKKISPILEKREAQEEELIYVGSLDEPQLFEYMTLVNDKGKLKRIITVNSPCKIKSMLETKEFLERQNRDKKWYKNCFLYLLGAAEGVGVEIEGKIVYTNPARDFFSEKDIEDIHTYVGENLRNGNPKKFVEELIENMKSHISQKNRKLFEFNSVYGKKQKGEILLGDKLSGLEFGITPIPKV